MDYITIALLAIGVFLVNLVVGAAVYAFIDDDERSLYEWYCKCPFGLEALILTFWPIGLYIWFINRR